MNKKYLSVILFGALMLGTTGTFTSCKDYDDDINNLQTQITANADAIKKLQDLVGEGKWVTSVVGIENGIKVTMNDGTTADILGINGEDGKDGKDGTVVTIIDGFWAFDGVKSEYPAVPGSASEAHEIKISEDGYWMIWDTEKGEYVTTTYAVAPVSAAQNSNGSWTITIKNADGTTSSINIPATALASIELDEGDPHIYDYYAQKDMTYWYGVVNEDVKWGWNEEETMEAGFYSKLDKDVRVLLNPAGVHGDSYAYTLKNSNGVQAPVTFFKTAVPYAGATLTTRTVASNGLWTLPAAVTKNPASDIEKLRRELYLSFKENDGNKYRLALEAADEQGNTVRTKYDNTVTLKKADAEKDSWVSVSSEFYCMVGQTYYPEINASQFGGQVYKYKLRVNQDPANLRRAEVYGATVTPDGQGYLATKDAGVYNYIDYDICGVFINGETFYRQNAFSVYFTNEMTTDRTWDAEAINKKPLDAKFVKRSDLSAFINNQLKSTGNVFAYTYTYDLSEKVAELSDTEKLVWDQALDEWSLDGRQINIRSLRDDYGEGLYGNGLIGGEGEYNSTNLNKLMNQHMAWTINPRNAAKNPNLLTVTFYVSDSWSWISNTSDISYANFKLNTAYQLTLYVVDPENETKNVAEIVLPFEFTMPTLGITRVKSTADDKSVLWTKDADNNDVLKVYGERGTEATKLPNTIFGDLRDAFTGAFDYEKGEYVATVEAGFYDIYVANVDQDKVLLGQFSPAHNPVTLADITTSSLWSEWNTWQNLPFDGADFATMEAEKVVYNHFGVYQEELPMFYVQFASKIEDGEGALVDGKGEVATPLMAQPVYNGSELTAYEVIINDANFDMKDAFGYKYYMFDSVTVKDGKAVDTKKRNALNNMWANDREGLKDDSNTYYGLNPTAKVDGNPAGSLVKFNLLTWNGGVWPTDGTYATQMKITIDKSVAAAKNNLVEVTLNVTDVFGHVYELPIYIQTVK